jgi:hypothetical protein
MKRSLLPNLSSRKQHTGVKRAGGEEEQGKQGEKPLLLSLKVVASKTNLLSPVT